MGESEGEREEIWTRELGRDDGEREKIWTRELGRDGVERETEKRWTGREREKRWTNEERERERERLRSMYWTRKWLSKHRCQFVKKIDSEGQT
jgi:hypothetical protein